MELIDAIRKLDAVAANIAKAEEVWRQIEALWPDEVAFIVEDEYENLASDFLELIGSLPNIDGWKPESVLVSPNEIAQARLDSSDIMEWKILFNKLAEAEEPAKQLSIYKHRYEKHRARIANSRIQQIIKEIDALLEPYAGLDHDQDDEPELPERPFWDALSRQAKEIEALLGRKPDEIPRWRDFRRHIGFAELNDLYDIVIADWPQISPVLRTISLRKNDPLEVGLEDLNELVVEQTPGPISTELRWDGLNAEKFERLVFNLINQASGYENAKWLSHTNAPDRGRDLSAERVTSDPLSGTRRERVIVQCKHYLKSSIGPSEVSSTKDLVRTWEPPKVDVLVFATSGRFTADAIKMVEQHNERGELPRLELWAESHLESLLATQPGIVAEFGLR